MSVIKLILTKNMANMLTQLLANTDSLWVLYCYISEEKGVTD